MHLMDDLESQEWVDFSRSSLNPLATVIQIGSLITDYSRQIIPTETANTIQKSQHHATRSLRPPLHGVAKINSDSTFSKLTGYCFAGIVLRDSEGRMVSGVTSNFRAINPLTK